MDWYHMLTWAVQVLTALLVQQSMLIEQIYELPAGTATTAIDFLFLSPPKAVTSALNWMQSTLPQSLDLSPLDAP